jgi:hypothetical protein
MADANVPQLPRRGYRVCLSGYGPQYACIEVFAVDEADAIIQTKDPEFIATLLECAEPEGQA